MDRIFSPIAGRPAAAVDIPTAAGSRAAGRRASRWLIFGAPVLVLVAGTALGLGVVREGWQPKAPPARTGTAAARATSPGDGASPPALRDSRSGYTDVDAGIGAPGVAAPTAPAAADTGSMAIDDGDAMPAALPARRPIDARPLAERPRIAAARDGARPARRDGAGGTTLPGCVPGSLEDRCIYQDVLNADGRLRRAFERARQDGVANRDLSAISRRWRQAREGAGDDPDGTIRRYDQLADALDDLRRETGE